MLNQEVFFAGPDTLNDPMEGLRHIFWQGDEIAWANLLRHYLLCLEWSYSILSLAGEGQPLSWKDIPIFNVDSITFTPQYRSRIDKLAEAFLGNEDVKGSAKSLAARIHAIRREEPMSTKPRCGVSATGAWQRSSVQAEGDYGS
ncbi:hypothetical protein [Bradyrhizobium genomosp. I (2014)]|uniref:hypothetical protein n=1 Tax=Bradyrhizobium genomosp. I (2014) TaxID=2683269 RepID=UPI0004AD8288|nr:hypothetical protein [Bradyrhizobium sp. CCBAU 43298]